jgi:hypothetical protein
MRAHGHCTIEDSTFLNFNDKCQQQTFDYLGRSYNRNPRSETFRCRLWQRRFSETDPPG